MSSFEDGEWESYLSSLFSPFPPPLSDTTYMQESSNYQNPDDHYQHQPQHNGKFSPLLHSLHSSDNGYANTVAYEHGILSHPGAVSICNQGQNLISNTPYPSQMNSQMSASSGLVPEEKVKPASASEKAIKISRYREKRLARCFQKKIRYPMHQESALRRNRKKGRFAPSDENFDKVDGLHMNGGEVMEHH